MIEFLSYFLVGYVIVWIGIIVWEAIYLIKS